MNTQKPSYNRVNEIPAHTQLGERGKIVSKTLAALVAVGALATVSLHHDRILNIVGGYIQKSTGMRQ